VIEYITFAVTYSTSKPNLYPLTFSLSYPNWYVLLCVLAGLLFAFILYRKNKIFSDTLSWVLSSLRFLTGFIACFMLLNPVLKWMHNTTEKPTIVLLQDNSASQQKAFEKINKTQYETALAEQIKQLSQTYTIKKYSYGGSVSDSTAINYKDNSTNIAEAMQQIHDVYENENLGAVIITGDGIYNKGANPALLGLPLKASVYAIGIGDTTLQKDAILMRTFSNKVVYAGDKFAVKLDVLGLGCNGSNATISIVNKNTGKPAGTQQISFAGARSSKTAEIIIDAGAKGIQQYSATISTINGEQNTINNTQEFYVEVIDSKEKILILCNSPHPDIYALQDALVQNKNSDVAIHTIESFNGKASDYNLIIMHNLPSTIYNCTSILTQAKAAGVGMLYIVGAQTSLPLYNAVQNALTIKASVGGVTDAGGVIDKKFNLFTINAIGAGQISSLPPLSSPFGSYAAGANTSILFNQKIGSVATNNPLWLLQQNGNQRTGVIAGEGFWRWRLYDFVQHKNHTNVDEFLQKTVQYLVVKQDKRQFRTHISKTINSINDAISFDAELYNDNFELITPNDVALTIADNKGNRYPYSMNKQEKNYTANIGTLPAGDYNFEARTSNNGKSFSETGSFKVVNIDIETINTTADFNTMYQLANNYSGKFLYHNQVSELNNLIKNNTNIKSVIKTQLDNEPLINWKWLFGLLLALLSIEWFVRKRNGGY
jgi:hypothetical protein